MKDLSNEITIIGEFKKSMEAPLISFEDAPPSPKCNRFGPWEGTIREGEETRGTKSQDNDSMKPKKQTVNKQKASRKQTNCKSIRTEDTSHACKTPGGVGGYIGFHGFQYCFMDFIHSFKNDAFCRF